MSKTDELLERINKMNSGEVIEEPAGVEVVENATIKLTVGQLATAAEANPEHPVAVATRKSVKTLNPSQEITMDRADVQALLENKEVVLDTKIETVEGEPRNVTRKSVGPELSVGKKPLLKT